MKRTNLVLGPVVLIDTSVWVEVFKARDPLDLQAVVDLEEVATCHRTARRNAITVRSSVDCLIAACALRHDLEVLHRDRDYPALARVSRLRHRSI